MNGKTKKSALPEQVVRLFTIGVKHEQSARVKRDIIFTNEVIFFLTLTSFLITTIDFLAGHLERSVINFVVGTFLIPAYFLQKRQLYKLTKFLTISIPAILAIVSSLVFGFQSNVHFYVLAIFVLSLVLYQKAKAHAIALICFGPLFISLLFIKESWDPLITGQDPRWMGAVHMGIVVLCIYVTLREYAMVFQSFEEKVVDLVDSIQDKNAELQAQKDFIEEQSSILQKTNLELQLSVREHEHTEELLRSSNENLEHFAYMASHDLKEPLRTVGSFTSLIQRRLKDKIEPEIGEYFTYVNSGVKRMATLLDDVLAMARMKKQVHFGKIDLNIVLSDVIMNLNANLQENNAEIEIPAFPQIIGNRVLLTQLFQNLIANGLKFRREEPPRIKVNVEDWGESLLFNISDNGIGIDEEYHEKVFHIFQRLHDRTKFEGSGIGLAMCKKIVENHGGKIWMKSKINVGTTIYFTLLKKPTGTPKEIKYIDQKATV